MCCGASSVSVIKLERKLAGMKFMQVHAQNHLLATMVPQKNPSTFQCSKGPNVLVLGWNPPYIVRSSLAVVSVAFNCSCSQRITPTVNVMTGECAC